MYKHGAVCGKFRIVHLAHRELIFVAAQKVEKLHIFICDQNDLNRVMRLEKTITVLDEIAQKTGTKYQIHILEDKELERANSSHNWDKLLLQKEKQLQVVFDSKEVYGNTLLKNEYIDLPLSSKSMSASQIEKDLFALTNFNYIAPEATKRLAVKFEFNYLAVKFEKIRADLNNYFGLESDYDIFSIDQTRDYDITIRMQSVSNVLDIIGRLRNV